MSSDIAPGDTQPSQESGTSADSTQNRVPILSLALIAILIAVWCVFTTNLTDMELQNFPLIVSGVLLALIAVFDVRIGLAVLLLAIGLSPEFEIYGIDNFRYEDIVFPIIFMIWISHVVLHKQKFRETDLKTPILVVVFISLISTLSNHIYYDLELRSAALRFGKSVEYYFMMVVVLNTMRTQRDVKTFAILMIGASAFVGLYGVIQYMGHTGDGPHRLAGPPGETANILGGYFVFHMCLALGMLTRVKSGGRTLLFLYLALMAMPFIMTLSRTSYVALFVGMVIIWILARNHTLGWAAVLIAAGALLAPNFVIDRFLTIFEVAGGGTDSSWEARVSGWTQWLIPQAMQSPLLGRGVGSQQLGNIDSEYVLQLNDLGIVGLIAFLVLISRCVRTSWRLHRLENEDPLLSGFSLGYFGGAMALMVHSLAATTFTTIRTTEPFFFATGLLYAYWNLSPLKNTHPHHRAAHQPAHPQATVHQADFVSHARMVLDPEERKKRLEKRFPGFRGKLAPKD